MSLPFQPSLFGAGEPGPDESFSTLRRCQLDDESWVEVAAAWMSGADTLFAELAGSTVWVSGNAGCTAVASPSPG